MSAPERIIWASPAQIEHMEHFGRISPKDTPLLPKDGLPREMAEALREVAEICWDQGFNAAARKVDSLLARWDEMEDSR